MDTTPGSWSPAQGLAQAPNCRTRPTEASSTTIFLTAELQKKKRFLITPLFVAIKIGWEKHVNYVKSQIATNCINPQFHLKLSFSPIQQVLQVIFMIFLWYIHDLQSFHMIFSRLFVFCTCRAHNLAENKTNLVGNQKKSWLPQNPWISLFASLRSQLPQKLAGHRCVPHVSLPV